MTAVQKPTTPVAPKTAMRASFRPRSNFACSAFSTLATIAAAVVNEPAGSANTETRKGGTIAFFAASNMSSASETSLPPMKMPVSTPASGGREKMASCTRPVTSPDAHADIGHDRVKSGIERHVHVERAHLLQRRQHVQNVLAGHFFLSGYVVVALPNLAADEVQAGRTDRCAGVSALHDLEADPFLRGRPGGRNHPARRIFATARRQSPSDPTSSGRCRRLRPRPGDGLPPRPAWR